MLKQIFYDWGGANVWLFQFLNGLRAPWLDQAMLWLTDAGDWQSFSVYVGLLALFALARERRGTPDLHAWLLAFAVFAVSYLLDALTFSALKDYFHYPRPALALGRDAVHLIRPLADFRSTPSGHAAYIMVVAASFWPVLGHATRLLAVLLVVGVGFSRINLGVHFPADVVFGWLIGLVVVTLVRWLLRRVFPARPRPVAPVLGGYGRVGAYGQPGGYGQVGGYGQTGGYGQAGSGGSAGGYGPTGGGTLAGSGAPARGRSEV